MVVAGVLTLAWAVVVWRWQDPFTALYTHWQQSRLSANLDHQFAAYHPVRIDPTDLAAERLAISKDARTFRHTAKTGQAIGRITIARIGLKMVLVNGTDHETLKKGPGRDARSYMPGQDRLVYIAGHRTTYLAPFAHIEQLVPGDTVTLELPYATIVYAVTGHVIVPSDDIGRLKSHGFEEVALQACHPRFFATHRYIAYARPTEVIPRNGSPYFLDARGRLKLAQPSGR